MLFFIKKYNNHKTQSTQTKGRQEPPQKVVERIQQTANSQAKR